MRNLGKYLKHQTQNIGSNAAIAIMNFLNLLAVYLLERGVLITAINHYVRIMIANPASKNPLHHQIEQNIGQIKITS